MAFRTKIDFSSNRQVKQHAETFTNLSGGTSFGITFSALTTGPDLSTSGVSESYTSIGSTFSGNSATTIYTWYDPRMQLGVSALSALTPLNSAITQNTGAIYAPSSTTVIDGNTVALAYTGVSFDISNIAMIDLGGGDYSGTVVSFNLSILTANTLDYTGRTIWVDVSGITRTEELIVTKNPQIGYVLTCIDSEGKMALLPSSGTTSGGTSYWSASTGSNAIVVNNSDASASGINSLAEGFQTTAGGNVSHAEGNITTASGFASHAEGANTTASGESSHAEGGGTTASGSNSHAEGGGTTASGSNSHAEGGGTVASANDAHAEGDSTWASGFASHAGGGGVAFNRLNIASGSYSFNHSYHNNTVNQLSGASGDYSAILGGVNQEILSGANYSAIICGLSNKVAPSVVRSVVLGGQNITATTSDYVYVPSLNIKTIGSSAFVNDIRIDGNGNLTTNTSDIRLKENVNKITNALDKIKALNGVTYQWKDKQAGGDGIKLGFIAQEVNQVDSNLTFVNQVDGYMGIHIDGIIPLLVEAVKELSSGVTTSGNAYLETQTILAEDNDIQLNYSGTQQTSIGGGLRVLHALGQNKEAEFITDNDGNWITNNNIIPLGLVIPNYTPSSSNDETGLVGNITMDDNYLYVKSSNKWKRVKLEEF